MVLTFRFFLFRRIYVYHCVYLLLDNKKNVSKKSDTGIGKPGRGSQDAPRPQTFLYSGVTIDHVGPPKVSIYLTLSWLSYPIDVSESGKVF